MKLMFWRLLQVPRDCCRLNQSASATVFRDTYWTLLWNHSSENGFAKFVFSSHSISIQYVLSDHNFRNSYTLFVIAV
jgi:hypothetical protein